MLYEIVVPHEVINIVLKNIGGDAHAIWPLSPRLRGRCSSIMSLIAAPGCRIFTPSPPRCRPDRLVQPQRRRPQGQRSQLQRLRPQPQGPRPQLPPVSGDDGVDRSAADSVRTRLHGTPVRTRWVSRHRKEGRSTPACPTCQLDRGGAHVEREREGLSARLRAEGTGGGRAGLVVCCDDCGEKSRSQPASG